MKFQIVYDKPGRIRFRCGAYAFDKELETAVQKQMLEHPAVRKAEAHAENGGILVYYEEGARNKVIRAVSALDTRMLIPLGPEESSERIDSDFKTDLVKLVAKRYIQNAILPAPIANAVILWKGLRYAWRAVKTLLNGQLNVDVLDGASVSACLLQRNFKTAGTIMFMLSISSLLEDYTRAKTKAALTDSLAIKTDKVWLVQDDTDVLIPMADLQVGDVIRVRTGSVIPVDGTVVSGEANINEASMTGEPLSVRKAEGSTVFAGTVVDEGMIAVQVDALSGNTKIQKIIQLIDNSENLKAGVQSRAENLADRIVPFSFLGFGLTLLLTRNITKAVSILMVDYSCAIKLSTPISVISAIREAADHDITVKGGKYLEAFAEADSIVFDKTGTLTNAEPVLERVISFSHYSEDEILKIAACIEEHFPHSVARAIVKGAAERNLNHQEEHAEVEYIVAHGIATTLHGKRAVHFRPAEKRGKAGNPAAETGWDFQYCHADRRQPEGGRGDRRETGHHPVLCTGSPGGQAPLCRTAESRRSPCYHGGRRHQRCSCTGGGKCFRSHERCLGYCERGSRYHAPWRRSDRTGNAPYTERKADGTDSPELSVYHRL